MGRLEELRLGAIEDRIDAELALDRGTRLVPELESLVAAHPLRERPRGQLMLALYRSGRQADALDRYRAWSASVRDELGLEPSEGLRELERAILTHDPALGSPARFRPRVRDRRLRRVALAALVAAGAAAAAAAIMMRGGTEAAVSGDSLAKIDVATNRIVGSVSVGHDPGQVALVRDLVFVASAGDHTLTRIDTAAGASRVSGAYDAGGSLVGAGLGLWVASENRAEVSSVEPDSLAALGRVGIRGNLAQVFLALGGGSLWVSEYAPPAVTRWSLLTLRLQRRFPLPAQQVPMGIAFGHGASWLAVAGSDELLRIDAVTGETSRIAVGFGPSGIAYGFDSVWSTMVGDGTVWRIYRRRSASAT